MGHYLVTALWLILFGALIAAMMSPANGGRELSGKEEDDGRTPPPFE